MEYFKIASNLREYIPHQWSRLNNLWYLFQHTQVLRNSIESVWKSIQKYQGIKGVHSETNDFWLKQASDGSKDADLKMRLYDCDGV